MSNRHVMTAVEQQSLENDPNFMTSLARGLDVIQAFSKNRRQLSISQISLLTGISRAAVRRCLHTLDKLGFVGSHDDRQFFLRPKILVLGQAYFSSSPIASIAQPVLQHLSNSLGESCSVAILEADEVFYIARAAVTRIMAIDLRVGSRLPAFCTSMGRILLANLPPEDLELYCKRLKLIRYTEKTVTSITKLKHLLDTIRHLDYAIVDQELEIGLRSLAVPVRDRSGKAVAALNVGCHAQRVSIRDLQKSYLPKLRSAADEIGSLV